MPRIVGVNIPENKKILYALTYIYGVGRSLSEKIIKEANIDKEKRAKDLSSQDFERIKNVIEKNYKIEGELKREKMMNIKRLKETGSWRGTRHQKGLPARGQRTRCNSRTIRGNVRRTTGSGKTKAPTPK